MLRLDHVSVRFGAVTAVDGVSLTVGAQEIVGLVGPNGAGKTTLFNAISGLARPSAGTLSFCGTALGSHGLHRRARLGIGRTFQVPQPLHELTVMENLRVAQRFATGKVDLAHLDEILGLVNLRDKAGRQAARELSLSELKALEVAKALATNPQLLLLDEVLAGLETSGKQRFQQMLARIHTQYRLSILLIEHDLETVMTLCQRVWVLNFGRLIADGTPQQVFNDPEVIRSYTGDAHARHS
jgi:branched-chain amino acid transport system ATP-binding protein